MISQRTLSFSKTEQKESCFTILLLLWFFLKDKWGERWTKNYDSLKETNLVGSLENRKDKIYCENVLFPGQIVKMWPQPTITFADIYKNMLWPTKEGNRDFSRSKKKKKKKKKPKYQYLNKRHQNSMLPARPYLQYLQPYHLNLTKRPETLRIDPKFL